MLLLLSCMGAAGRSTGCAGSRARGAAGLRSSEAGKALAPLLPVPKPVAIRVMFTCAGGGDVCHSHRCHRVGACQAALSLAGAMNCRNCRCWAGLRDMQPHSVCQAQDEVMQGNAATSYLAIVGQAGVHHGAKNEVGGGVHQVIDHLCRLIHLAAACVHDKHHNRDGEPNPPASTFRIYSMQATCDRGLWPGAVLRSSMYC